MSFWNALQALLVLAVPGGVILGVIMYIFGSRTDD